jgi:outer membrane lipoprotein-sorting protein
MRSAAPTLDPATTHLDLAPARKTGAEWSSKVLILPAPGHDECGHHEGEPVAANDDIASLMYRPLWPSRSLIGSVSRFGADGHHGEVWSLRGELMTGPGGRYRTGLVDDDGDRTQTICDGQSVWVIEDGEEGFGLSADGSVPFGDLLNPAWLLAKYALTETGSCQHADRDGIALAGYERDVLGIRDDRTGPGRIDAVMDAELGILLSYRKSGQPPEGAEFTHLAVADGDSADLAQFQLPDTASATGDRPPGESPSAASGSEPMSDELIELLYHAGLRPRRFSAVLHERAETDAIAALIRETGRDRGGVLGSAIDFGADLIDPVDLTAQVDLALPGSYRIEIVTGHIRGPIKMISDGHTRWQLFEDRAARARWAVPPAGFGKVIDLAWLLDGYRLTLAGQEPVHGRPARQIVAKPDDGSGVHGQGTLARVFFAADHIEVDVDAELGIALTLTWYWRGQALATTSLENVSELAATATFQYQPPPGMRVITSLNPLTAISAKDAAKSAVKAAHLLTDMAKHATRRRWGP